MSPSGVLVLLLLATAAAAGAVFSPPDQTCAVHAAHATAWPPGLAFLPAAARTQIASRLAAGAAQRHLANDWRAAALGFARARLVLTLPLAGAGGSFRELEQEGQYAFFQAAALLAMDEKSRPGKDEDAAAAIDASIAAFLRLYRRSRPLFGTRSTQKAHKAVPFVRAENGSNCGSTASGNVDLAQFDAHATPGELLDHLSRAVEAALGVELARGGGGGRRGAVLLRAVEAVPESMRSRMMSLQLADVLVRRGAPGRAADVVASLADGDEHSALMFALARAYDESGMHVAAAMLLEGACAMLGGARDDYNCLAGLAKAMAAAEEQQEAAAGSRAAAIVSKAAQSSGDAYLAAYYAFLTSSGVPAPSADNLRIVGSAVHWLAATDAMAISLPPPPAFPPRNDAHIRACLASSSTLLPPPHARIETRHGIDGAPGAWADCFQADDSLPVGGDVLRVADDAPLVDAVLQMLEDRYGLSATLAERNATQLMRLESGEWDNGRDCRLGLALNDRALTALVVLDGRGGAVRVAGETVPLDGVVLVRSIHPATALCRRDAAYTLLSPATGHVTLLRVFYRAWPASGFDVRAADAFLPPAPLRLCAGTTCVHVHANDQAER